MAEKLSDNEEQKFLQHQLQRTPEYLFAQKMTTRLTRDLKLFTSIAAELLMISQFSQKDKANKINIETQFIANEVRLKGVDGIGVCFVFSTNVFEQILGTAEPLELGQREFLIEVQATTALCSLNKYIDASDDAVRFGPYELKGGKLDSALLIAIADWLLHRSQQPPTKLNSRFW